MTGLKRAEIDEIVAYHVDHTPRFLQQKTRATLAEIFTHNCWCDDWASKRRWLMRTKFYNFLTLCGDDVEVRTVAVRSDRHGDIRVKEVIRASVGAERMEARDIAYRKMSGYVVDWSPEGISRNCEWNDTWEGIWCPQDYTRRGMWRLDCAVINPGVLAGHPRWKYNAWQPECGDILGYLKLYAEHPKIEMLVKIGFPRFAAMPGFVKQMERDKEFLRYLSKNAAEIKDGDFAADAVRKAYRLRIPLSRAFEVIAARRSFHGNLPLAIDAEKARAYIRSQRGMTDWDYTRYLGQCVKLGQDLSDTKVAFPRHGHRRIEQVQAMIDEIEGKKDAAARRAMAKDLRARAARFGAVCEKVDGGLVAHVPSREKEFIEEGKKLHHCVGRMGYAAKMARGESLIVFVRDASAPDRPFVTAEIEPETGKVLQCYGKDNSRTADAVLAFVEKKVGKAVARIAKREKREQLKRGCAEAQRVA